MQTILSLIGTRPETIKMAPVIKELNRHPDSVRSVVCATAQHREMLDQVLGIFGIEPEFDLDVMEPDQKLSRLTATLFSRFDSVVEAVKPNWVLAVGDTTSVLVSALVSYYRRVPFGHVEAGLRTGDKYQPYPEEINRRIADQLADALFAPTRWSEQNLLREGRPAESILLTGNTVVDSLLSVKDSPFDWNAGPLFSLPRDKKIILVTAHRRESFGTGLRDICAAIRELAARFVEYRFVYPVHPNPNVRGPVRETLIGVPNVNLIDPLDYLSMVALMKQSVLILTDSGGIQEEAPTLGIPVLVMRDVTERPEGIEAGVAKVVGTNRDRIVEETAHLLSDKEAYAAMVSGSNPYGDGKAATRIVSFLLRHPSHSEFSTKADRQ